MLKCTFVMLKNNVKNEGKSFFKEDKKKRGIFCQNPPCYGCYKV